MCVGKSGEMRNDTPRSQEGSGKDACARTPGGTEQCAVGATFSDYCTQPLVFIVSDERDSRGSVTVVRRTQKAPIDIPNRVHILLHVSSPNSDSFPRPLIKLTWSSWSFFFPVQSAEVV